MAISIDRDELDDLLARRGASGADLAKVAGVCQATIVAARQGRPLRPLTVRRIRDGLRALPELDLLVTTRAAGVGA